MILVSLQQKDLNPDKATENSPEVVLQVKRMAAEIGAL